MPLRVTAQGPIYRQLTFGRLAEISVLDLRTYRSQQVAQGDLGAVDDPARTITGAQQMAWLRDGLQRSASQ